VVDPRHVLIGGAEGACGQVTVHGKPCGSVGTGVGNGGSVGNDGVLVGTGVGVGGSVGAGGRVGELVAAGGAVGGAVGGGGGADVRVSAVAVGVADRPVVGDAGDAAAPLVGVGDAVTDAEGSGCSFGPPLSCITLNPARARPTASDGPRSTYKVKDARPPWPRPRPGFPSNPPTLVDSSYRPEPVDKWRQRCNGSTRKLTATGAS